MILQFVAPFQLAGMSTAQFVRTALQTQSTTAAQNPSAVDILHLTKVIQKSSQILIRFIHTRNSSRILVIISSLALSFQSVSCSQNFKTQAEK